MAERYRDELKSEIPEIDAVLGTGEVPEIVGAISRRARPPTDASTATASEPQSASPQAPEPLAALPTYIYDADTPRLLATPRHYAYVKIAEGCDYKCAFCIIPTLRGAYRSRPADSIVREARALAARGVKELLLISQDTTFYGIDRHERGALGAAAARAERGRRPRVDPAALPLSHHDRRRHARGDGGVREGLQVHRPAAAARVEPGAEADEAARHAAELRHAARRASARACPASRSAPRSSSASPARPRRTSTSCRGFVADHAFDHVGVFTYSHEEGTSAYALDDDVPARTKTARRNRVMGLQKQLVRKRQRARIGERARVMVDGPSPDHELVLKGAAVDPGARHRRLGLSDRMRPVELTGRAISPRSRSSAPATTTSLPDPWPEPRRRLAGTVSRAIILDSKPGCRTEWAVCPLF